jgi:hypothetical protein
LDVERLVADPSAAARELSSRIHATPGQLIRRLPRRKRLRGKASEAYERLTGRESTEVRIFHKLHWNSAGERASVDAQFQDVYAELSQRALPPAHAISPRRTGTGE